jgi:hypothetical protein
MLFMSFLLDQKGLINQGPTEICLSSIRNFGKTKTRHVVARLRQFVLLIEISLSTPRRQISEWPKNFFSSDRRGDKQTSNLK